MIRPTVLAALVSLGIAWNCSCADEQAAQRNPEEAAIRKAAAQYAETLKRGDAAALAAAWTKDGDYVDSSGSVFKASDLIKKQFPPGSVAREAEPKKIATSPGNIRIISGDVAIEDGVYQVRSAGEEAAATGRYTVVWKKQGGRWLIDSVRESAASGDNAAGAAPPADLRLTDLAWLVGDWKGSADATTYELSAHFLEGDRVLELKFEAFVDGRRVVVGNEYITRDPGTGDIKSCFIDSRGGHGEGLWTLDDNIWTVDTLGALVDGTLLETTNTYTLHKDGSITWCALNAKLDGEDVPDVSVRFSRKAAK